MGKQRRVLTKARGGGTAPAPHISQVAVHIPEKFSPDAASWVQSRLMAETAAIICSHLREGLVRTAQRIKVIACSQQMQLHSQKQKL